MSHRSGRSRTRYTQPDWITGRLLLISGSVIELRRATCGCPRYEGGGDAVALGDSFPAAFRPAVFSLPGDIGPVESGSRSWGEPDGVVALAAARMPPGIGSPVLESETKLCRSSRPVNSSGWSPACSATWRKARRTWPLREGWGVRVDVELVEGLLPGAQHDAESRGRSTRHRSRPVADHQQERGYDFCILRNHQHNEFCVLQINFLDLLAQCLPGRPRYGRNPAHHRSRASESADRRRGPRSAAGTPAQLSGRGNRASSSMRSACALLQRWRQCFASTAHPRRLA
jgi:hypothetical protein